MNTQPEPYSSVIDVIGKTPVVELSRLSAGLQGRLLAKLEYLNPGFSKKDRIARQIIEEVARRITAERAAFRADQFHVAGNFRAHYLLVRGQCGGSLAPARGRTPWTAGGRAD